MKKDNKSERKKFQEKKVEKESLKKVSGGSIQSMDGYEAPKAPSGDPISGDPISSPISSSPTKGLKTQYPTKL